MGVGLCNLIFVEASFHGLVSGFTLGCGLHLLAVVPSFGVLAEAPEDGVFDPSMVGLCGPTLRP